MTARTANPVRDGFRRALTLALLLAAAPAFAQGPRGGGPPEATAVGMDQVRLEETVETAPVIGRLVARRSGVVAAETRGPVASIDVEVGERVEEGQVLARLETARLEGERAVRQAELNSRVAAIREAEARLAQARSEAERLTGLRGSAAFSPARFDDARLAVTQAESAVTRAKADREVAEAQLRLSEIELAKAVTKAPYPGVVTQRMTEIGAYVNPGSPLVAMVNDTDLEVEADVPATRLGGLSAGVPVDVSVGPKLSLKASVRAIVPDENPRTRTRSVRFTLSERPSDDALLAANQPVTLEIPLGQPREMLTVPKDAVLARGGGNIVYVVENGTASVRPVTIGTAAGARFEVLDGLKQGDTVVVRGNERLRPGQKVRPMGQGGPQARARTGPPPAAN